MEVTMGVIVARPETIYPEPDSDRCGLPGPSIRI